MNRNLTTFFNIASTIIIQGLTFISGPIFSSLLGTENYGIALVYLTWVQISSVIFSLQAGGTLAVARVNFPEDEQPAFQSSVLSLATISYLGFSLITLIVSLILSPYTGLSIPMILLGLAHGWGLYCVGVVNGKFTYEFKANRNFILSVTTSALTIGLSIFLIKVFPAEINYWGRIIGQSSVYFLIGIVLYAFLLIKGKTVVNLKYWRFALPIALPTIFHSLSHIVLYQSDKIMLQRMASNSAVGIYGLACTFGAVLSTIWAAFNNSWVPFYYEFTRQNQIDEMRKHAKNYIELFTILAMGFILLAKEVFHIYAGKDFWGGTDFIPIFSIGYYFIFLYSFPVNYEFYNKKTKTIAIGTTLAAICNIVLNYFMIKMWSAIGAVIATAVSHGLQFAFHYINAKKINPGEYPFTMNDFIVPFACVCATCVFYAFTREFWMLRWGIGAALGVYLLVKIIRRREIF